MTLFAVMMPQPQPKLEEAILHVFPHDHLALTNTQWLISSSGTAVEVTAKLGIYDASNPTVTTGNAIVFAVSSYYGRAPSTVWDWIRAKLEASPNG